jgi:hypothetical protein
MIEIRSPELVRLIQLFGQAPEIVGEEMERAAHTAAGIAEEEVRARTPVRTGRLQGAVKSRVEGAGRETRAILTISGVPYAGYVEEGTGVHHEPGAREPWTVRPVNKKALRFMVGGKEVFSKSATIQGMRPRHMVRDGARAAGPRIVRVYEAALRRAVQRMRTER